MVPAIFYPPALSGWLRMPLVRNADKSAPEISFAANFAATDVLNLKAITYETFSLDKDMLHHLHTEISNMKAFFNVTHHDVTKAHLWEYPDEFDFRYNWRKCDECFLSILQWWLSLDWGLVGKMGNQVYLYIIKKEREK